MGFRFRRSIKILPDIRLNIGKRGASASIGVRGAHVTLGRGQVRASAGIPGTGLSYTHAETVKHTPEAPQPASAPSAARGLVFIVLVLIAAVVIWRALH